MLGWLIERKDLRHAAFIMVPRRVTTILRYFSAHSTFGNLTEEATITSRPATFFHSFTVSIHNRQCYW